MLHCAGWDLIKMGLTDTAYRIYRPKNRPKVTETNHDTCQTGEAFNIADTTERAGKSRIEVILPCMDVTKLRQMQATLTQLSL
jgi:hypothetical protein